MYKNRFETNPNKITITSPFWMSWRKKIADIVIPYQWEVINDERPVVLPKDPGGGASSQTLDTSYSRAVRNLRIASLIRNKKLKVGDKKANFQGFVFQDSDVYKWLEEAAYALSYTNNKKLKKLCDDVIDLIASAQESDGYLDTPYQIKSGLFKNRKRFTQIQQSHEMYVMGHYIEAGVAYYQVTGNKKALKVAEGMANCLANNFGYNKIPGADGHPEIELALARLYEVTKNEKYLKLGKFFIDVRGKDPTFYDKQNEKIGDGSTDIFPIMRTWSHEYSQTARPIIKQQVAQGHAVRVAYMLTGVAHLARLTGDLNLKKAAKRLWSNIVNKRMYITGAVGSTRDGEAYTYDYDLPNDLIYGESCASVGISVLAHRMMQLELNGEYADILEKELFNSGISGIALDGKHFYYVNPLEADPIASKGNSTKEHVLTQRAEWFLCACCPSNIARYIAGVHRFIYTLNEIERTICAHQFIANKATLFNDIKVEQISNFPWEGKVKFIVMIPKGVKPIKFITRIPSWSKDHYQIKLNNKNSSIKPVNGLITFVLGEGKHIIDLDLDMKVKFMRSNTRVRFDTGKIAVMRGPVVYCAEGVDNLTPLWNYKLNSNNQKDIKVTLVNNKNNVLNGLITLEVPALYRSLDQNNESLYMEAKAPKVQKVKLKLIPYFAWANRGDNPMLVWFDSDL